jgi:hypothetical protein
MTTPEFSKNSPNRVPQGTLSCYASHLEGREAQKLFYDTKNNNAEHAASIENPHFFKRCFLRALGALRG